MERKISRPVNRKPTHPGGIIKRQYMDTLGLTMTELAKGLNVSRKTVSKLVNERGAVTADMALRLSQAFGTTPEFWLKLQEAVDLWEARQNPGWDNVKSFHTFMPVPA